MEILKKDVIKEMEEKSRENLNRGIDIAVSILKHEFPFITGWDYKYNPESFRLSIYLVLMADMNLASEFYSSPIRNVYKHAEARVAYPFSPLEISTELNEDEKYELFKVIQKSLIEIYDEIPSELRHEFESYSSEKKEPKELYIEGFIFEKPKENINEQFDIDYYETKYNPPKEESDEEIKNLTKNDLLEYGKRYFSKKFFRLFSPKKWRHAVNNRWLEDICNELHWDECGGDNKKIYGFFFEKDGQKYVYVGITNNITSRFRTHLDIKKTRLSKFQKAIEELEIDPKDIDFSVLFPFFLPPNNAAQIEINLIKYFIEDPNYICLNAATGGQLGSRGSSKYIIDNSAKLIKIQNIKDEEEFMKLYPKEYDYLKKTRRLKYVNNLLDKRFFKQGQYSEKELEQIAKQYPSRGKLRMIDVNAYEAIRHRGLLDKFFPRNINESKSDEIQKNIEVINLIISEISWDGLCEIWVEYNEVDGDYEIRSKSTKRHFDYDDIVNELGYLQNTLRSMDIRNYIFTPWYVEECEDEVEFLNESEKETNYIPIIEEIIEPFKNEDCVCEIKVLYDEEDDMYSVYLVLGNEELNNNFFYVNGIRKYRDKLANKIKTEIKSYLPINNLYVGSYGKPNCGWSPLNESEDRPNKESINTLINDLILPQYEHIICDIEYKDTEERFDVTGKKTFNYPSATVTFIGGYGTKWWPRTLAVNEMYDNILNDVWDTIYDYTGIHVELYSKHVKNCKESINENWFKVPSSEYNSLEKIINMEMREKYGWWKDIKINTLNYIELYGDVQIEAELTVDEEWGANQWREFYPISEFPSNKGWEDNDDYRKVSLGDIMDSTYAEVIRNDLREILRYALNIEAYNMSFRNVYLIFE